MTDVFKDLAERAKSAKETNLNSINRLTFLSFVDQPGVIGERMFSVCTQDQEKQKSHKTQKVISLIEFKKLMQKIFYSRVETKMQLVFEIFDFDSDGKISVDDIKLILSHVPLSSVSPTF